MPWAATWAAGLHTGLPIGLPSSPQPPKPTQSRPRPATREMTHRNRCARSNTAVHLQRPCEWHPAAASNCQVACTEAGVAPAAGAAHKCTCKPPEPLNISRCLCREHTPFQACLSLPVASLDLNCLECATRCGHCECMSIPLSSAHEGKGSHLQCLGICDSSHCSDGHSHRGLGEPPDQLQNLHMHQQHWQLQEGFHRHAEQPAEGQRASRAGSRQAGASSVLT